MKRGDESCPSCSPMIHWHAFVLSYRSPSRAPDQVPNDAELFTARSPSLISSNFPERRPSFAMVCCCPEAGALNAPGYGMTQSSEQNGSDSENPYGSRSSSPDDMRIVTVHELDGLQPHLQAWDF